MCLIYEHSWEEGVRETAWEEGLCDTHIGEILMCGKPITILNNHMK